MNKILSTSLKALFSTGFIKAFCYSLGSFMAGWTLIWLTIPEVVGTLGKYGIVIPLINWIVVFAKQYFDENKKSLGKE